ncbi:hypothetical protein DSL72_001581 [Monilinia vaccinii-corymbosi]|uniref:Uncharacterized protein n=1 Tax=Monilinia vaccinii-corymbosi TaxID=61207 RepID=A0A8A3P466_9HELO|nr:hypothetical protein DSL72_001581 [Monilinia vaccinii-corymbosi]
MNSNQAYSSGGAWSPAQHSAPQQNWQSQQPQQSPFTQYSPEPFPQLFCCEMCQRVAVPATQTIHAYTTRLAFFFQHIMHPTIATYAQPPNRQLHHAFFDILPLSTFIPPASGYVNRSYGSHGQQQHPAYQHQGYQQGVQQQAPTEPMAHTHYTAAYANPNSYQGAPNQTGFMQQEGYQSGVGYAQPNYQQHQPAAHSGPRNNQPPQSVLGPIMYGGSSYSIDPSIPIPLPDFVRPECQLNVKFRLERHRLERPAAPFPYGNPAHGPYQPQAHLNTPYQANNIVINTNSPRAKENMELIWYYWPVQLEIPLWARGQNSETSAPEIAQQLVCEGMQMINGERWAFVDDREDREGLWHKRRSYKVLECPVHGMLWKVTVFVRRGY